MQRINIQFSSKASADLNYMKRIIGRAAFFICLMAANVVYGQTVKGVLRDEIDNSAVSGATVKLIALKDSSLSAVTDKKGSFTIQGATAGKYTLSITSIGYAALRMPVTVTAGGLDLGNIPIGKSSKVLSTVNIVASAPPVKQKQDTVEYSANSFKTNPDATAEDLIKKMPGITVDKAGTVTAHGDQVKKVTVDGKEFFGDDATAALRNLPSEVIDKIQVFDKLSDQAAFTGFDDGSSVKAINIVTKSNMRNGQFGRVYAGYGTDQRYAAGGNVSFFNGNRRISFVGLFNNVNQQNFSSQDLLGVTSSGGRGGRGGGGNRGGGPGAGGFQGGNGSNFLVGAQNGISTTNAFGINYSNQLGKKLTITGSYFFNNSSTPNTQTLTQQYLNNNSDSVRYYNETNRSTNNNYNNRINLRLEYKIDSANSLIITPNLSFQNNTSGSVVNGINSFGTNRIISETDNTVNTTSSGYNINNGILLRHMFHKRGRTISVGMNNSLSNRKGDTYLQAYNKYYKGASNYSDSLNQLSDNKNDGNKTSFNLSYT